MNLMPDPGVLAGSPWLESIAWAYMVTNLLRLITFPTQIVAVCKCTDGAQAISLWTWSSWVLANTTGVLYGVLVMHDLFFVVITAINLLGSGLVTLIALHKRLAFQHGQHRDRPDAGPDAVRHG